MTRRKVHIGLLFHSFESENLGVGAFTVANSAMIGEAIEKYGGSPVFHVIGVRGDKDYRHTCPWPTDFTNIGNKSLLNPVSDLHRVIRRCDAFFDIGAGDSFSDIYASSRFVRIVAAKLLAARTGNPLVLSPQTIGPFTTRWGKLGARLALRGAQKIFARDGMSLEAAHALGMAQKSELTTDLAFALPYDVPARRDRGDLATGALKVGINVSGLLFDLAGQGTGRIRLALDYAALIRKLIVRLLGDPRVESVHIVPHVLVPRYPADDDGGASRQLKAEFPALVIAPDFASPPDAKTYIAGLDLLLGARMHATIAALSSDTAVLPMAYSRKFNGLYSSLDYPYLIDMVNCDETAALAEFERVMDDLSAVSRAAIRSNALAQDKLRAYRDYLDQFAAELLAP